MKDKKGITRRRLLFAYSLTFAIGLALEFLIPPSPEPASNMPGFFLLLGLVFAFPISISYFYLTLKRGTGTVLKRFTYGMVPLAGVITYFLVLVSPIGDAMLQ